MADKQILEQMLEHLVNEDQAKAEELFHDYVVAKSREIYESLIDSEISEEAADTELEEGGHSAQMIKDKENMSKAEFEKKYGDAARDMDDDDDEEEKVDEEFEDIAIEGDDEMDDMGGDPTDDLEGEMGPEEGEDDMGEKDPEELFQDLDSIVDELQAKFDAMNGGEEGEDEGEEEMKDEFDLETVREYVEKVPTPKMGDKGENNGLKFSKNDMGGTTANILSSKEEAGTMAGQGQLKGNGLLKGAAKEDNAGNINVPGGKAGGAFSKKEPGHGAEKKGAAEQSDKSAGSLFRGRR